MSPLRVLGEYVDDLARRVRILEGSEDDSLEPDGLRAFLRGPEPEVSEMLDEL